MTNTKDHDIKNILLDIDKTIAQNTQSSMKNEDMRDEARKLLTNPPTTQLKKQF